MTSPPFAPGWYPDPSGAAGSRYWDGHNWGPLAPPGAVHDRSGNGKASLVTIAQGVSLILFALIFGYFHARALPDVPTRRAQAPELVDTVWRTYFLVMLALCVVALIVGILSLARPEAHPLYSVIAGAAVILVGLVGCLLGVVSVGNGDDMGTPIAYLLSGFLFACGGAEITVLSGIVLAKKRRSQRSTVMNY